MPSKDWYSVRSIFRSDTTEDGKPRRAFEERVVLFRAESFDEALAKGEAEAKQYASDWPHPKILNRIVAFHIHDEDLREGDEVWSCIRDLDISDEEFHRRIFDGEFENSTNARLQKRDG
jgi:hypothetical protein